MMEVWENVAGGPLLFTELSYLVASCIMLDSARHGIKGGAGDIFPQYVEHLDAALENFCDRHWPCECVKHGSAGGRCVNVRSGHGSKGHQLKSGKVLAVGPYQSEFSFLDYQKTFQANTFIRLVELLKLLRERQDEENIPEDEAAAEIHQQNVLRNFYAHTIRGRCDAYISHTACFCCLFDPPEHALPCGHILCTRCLNAFGISRKRNIIEIDSCPIDDNKFVVGTWTVVMKPETAGVRILTLDGGGIRGIVELEILRQIEKELNGISIQSFFDMIIGTSTGGIIALGLVANDWTVSQCTQSFKEFCQKAFTARTGINLLGLKYFVELHHHSQYETQPLQEALIEAYGENYLFGGPREKRSRNLGFEVKVAVTSASTAGNAIVLANYNRPCRDKLPYHFQRPEKLCAELKTWEAARATSAAPRIFKPMSHEPSKQVYADGAIYHNNPIQIADQERKLIWPSIADDPPDIIVSIGTSYNPNSIQRLSMQRTSTLQLGALNQVKNLLKIAMDCIASTLDAQKTWENYIEILNPPSQDWYRYVRLNPKLCEDPPELDEVGKMDHVEELARTQMHNEKERIEKLALHLIATSFYFERMGKEKELPEGGHEIRGHIHCRLTRNEDICRLGKHMKFLAINWQPYFIIQEQHCSHQSEKFMIPYDVIETMISSYRFKMKAFTVKLSSRRAFTDIFLCLNRKDLFHISRFPRSLLQDDHLNSGKFEPYCALEVAWPSVKSSADKGAVGTRYTIAANSSRWAGRSHSQRHRNHWAPPSKEESNGDSEVISSYSNPTYVLGNTSNASLRASASRLFGKGLVELDGTGLADTEELYVPAIVQFEAAELDAVGFRSHENHEIYEMAADF